jgi:hypothetical protein
LQFKRGEEGEEATNQPREAITQVLRKAPHNNDTVVLVLTNRPLVGVVSDTAFFSSSFSPFFWGWGAHNNNL